MLLKLMMNVMINNYKYYKGENKCPFTDSGRAFWWRVESYAAEVKDLKDKDELSFTMINYLRELHWLGDAHHDTTEEVFLERAKELYRKGLWNRDYICFYKAYI